MIVIEPYMEGWRVYTYRKGELFEQRYLSGYSANTALKHFRTLLFT